jgi:hypothetical protein
MMMMTAQQQSTPVVFVPPIVAIRSPRDRLIDALVDSLVEYHLTKKEDLIIMKNVWDAEALVFLEHRKHLLIGNDNGNSSLEEIVSAVFARAMQKAQAQAQAAQDSSTTKATTTSNNDDDNNNNNNKPPSTNTSQSLFASGGGLFSSFPPLFDFSQLETAASVEAQLDLLKTAHLDDLMMDWDSIDKITRDALMPVSHNSNTTTTSNHDVEVAVVMELYEKWLQNCRTFNDSNNNVFSTIITNLLEWLQSHSTSQEASIRSIQPIAQQALLILWKLWMHWTTNLLPAGAGVSMTSCFTQLATTLLQWHTLATLRPLHNIWMKMDPYAMWIHSWTAASVDAAKVCVGHADFMAEIGAACLDRETQQQQHCCMYYWSVIRSLLVTLRVPLFPWSSLFVGATSSKAVMTREETIIQAIFDSACRQVLASLALPTTEQMILTDIIDTILSGCRFENKSLFQKLLVQLETNLYSSDQNRAQTHRIQEVVDIYKQD